MPGGAIGMRAMTTPPFLDGRAVDVRSNGLAPLARAAIVCARSISSGGITDPSFLPNDTTLDDFVHDGSPARGDALLAWEPRSYMGGFVKVAREHARVELVGIESPLWPRAGTGSGWITREAYEHFLGRMIADRERGGRWHGVYLALHGAMGVRGVARPEADIA